MGSQRYRAGGQDRVSGVERSPTGPFPTLSDQIEARDIVIRALWESSANPVNGLDQDHADLLKEIVGIQGA